MQAPPRASGHTQDRHVPKVLLTTCGGYWYPRNAQVFERRGALAGLLLAARKKRVTPGLPAEKVLCCWPVHLGMMPFYFWAPQIWTERVFYASFPVWKAWLMTQRVPWFNVVQAILGYGSEVFDRAEKIGALKVADAPNSHPDISYGDWQRECDLWCPGEKVPVPQWLFARQRRELARADVVLCLSDFVRDTMVAHGVPAEKCFINPFGVDTGVFKRGGGAAATPRFICVGTICLRKGHQYLFRAFEQLRKEVPGAELICVGDYKSDFRMERPKWEGQFRHYPHLTHAELAKLLPTCTAFVLASIEEGFARVLSEAMAAGLPIVATYETGATTLVSDGVEGLIVPARDPAALAKAMARLAKDGDLCRRMGAAAYERGAVRNTWQDYGDRLLAEYSARLERREPTLVQR